MSEILNEVTVTILGHDKVNFHSTFMLDTTVHKHFKYNGKQYDIPYEDTGHYPIGFWKWNVKLGNFFRRHKTWASLFDWFHLAKNASYEIGYLYWEDNPDPEDFNDPKYKLEHDWGYVNYLLSENTTIEGACQDADERLHHGQSTPVNAMMLILLVAAAIIAVIVVYSMFIMPHGTAHQIIQNVTTSTGTP